MLYLCGSVNYGRVKKHCSLPEPAINKSFRPCFSFLNGVMNVHRVCVVSFVNSEFRNFCNGKQFIQIFITWSTRFVWCVYPSLSKQCAVVALHITVSLRYALTVLVTFSVSMNTCTSEILLHDKLGGKLRKVPLWYVVVKFLHEKLTTTRFWYRWVKCFAKSFGEL